MPRTTLALEWHWASSLATSAATPPVWHLGWGVTYHALTTLDVALLVNHEQAQGLGAAQIYLGARWYPGGQR